MHLVVFDIDGTLINTNPKDGECYWRAICELMGFSSEQPVSSPLYSVPMSSAIDASWGESEEATLRTLSSHRKLIDSLIEQRHGRIVNSAGDSVLAEFASVVNAVQCAVEIKTTLRAENGNIPLSGEGIPQFGINTDDVRVARQERQRPLRTALIAHFSQSPMRPSESPDPAASRLSCDPSAQFSCLSMEPDREKSPAILPVVSVTKEIMDVKT